MTVDAFELVAATAPYVAAMAVLALIMLAAMLVFCASVLASRANSRKASASLRAVLRDGDDDARVAAIMKTPISVLSADSGLRQQVDEELARVATRRATSSPDPRRPRAAESDPRQLAFTSIEKAFAPIPPTIPENDANPPQKRSMESLADTLAPMREPFRSWSTTLKHAAEKLGSVVPMREKVPELLSMPLQAKAHFDADFKKQATEVRSKANDGDDAACGDAIQRLAASVVEWVQLTEDWYSLRQDAARLIGPWTSADKPWHGELGHVAVEFRDPSTGARMVWWQSSLLSRSDSLERLSAWIIREIDDRVKDGRWKTSDFSAICSMSSTGVPLATLLSSHYRKRLLITDAGAGFAFPPGLEPRTDEAVLLVDSNLSTGDHLDRCSRRIRRAGALVMGAVVICEDDLPGKDRLPIVEELRTGNRLIPLFTLSDFYKLFQEKKRAALL